MRSPFARRMGVLVAAVSCALVLSVPVTAQQPAAGAQASSPEAYRKKLISDRRAVLQPQLEDVRKQLAEAKAAGDAARIAALADIEEEFAVTAYGAALPSYLWRTPARFSILAGKKSVRFIAFGDFGTGEESQKRVAAAMRAEHRKKAFNFAITVGDNFYGSGMNSPQDPRWQTQWEELYTPMKIPFYASLGNHDWYQPDSPAAEITYSERSKSWVMPSTYYSYVAGPVEFFALNTEVLTERQLMWLKKGIDESKATWKIVYGHHPIYSGSRSDNKTMSQRLLPLLLGRVDAYIAGHDHVLAHLKPEQGVEFFVSGGGGAKKYNVRPENGLQLFGEAVWGFLTVDVSAQALQFRFIDETGKALYSYTAKKDGGR